MDQIQRIKNKLIQLKKTDSQFTVFGSSSHKYKINPVLTLEEINKFEKKHQIKLPEGYIQFLSEIENGGAGPYYGLETLEYAQNQSLDYPDLNLFNNLSQSFPHTEYWNPESELEDIDRKIEQAYKEGNEDLEEKLYEERLNIINEEKHNYGILNLSNYGCGVSIFLVVNGKEYGNMWTDDRVSDGGIYPSNELGNKSRIEFLDWYELWLDQSLEKCNTK